MGSFTYSLLTLSTPEYLASHMLERSTFAPRLTRSTYMELITPYFATRVYEKSFMVTAIKFWNNLPEDIRRSSSLLVFKRNLFKFLLDVQASATSNL